MSADDRGRPDHERHAVKEPEIAFIRSRLRSTPDVYTYEAVRVEDLDARLAESGGKTIVEDCEIVLPIPTLSKLKADLAAAGCLRPGFIGTVTPGGWLSGPLAGQDGPRGFEWYG